MKNIFWSLTIGLFFIQCSHTKLPIYDLIEFRRIDIVSDTLLFNDIKCLTFYDSSLYFTNPVYDQIVVLNKKLGLERILGKRGNGANELLGINQFAMRDSLISVLNVSNQRINIFSTNGKLKSETPISNSILFDPNYRYCFMDTVIIGSSSVSEAPLSKYYIYKKESIPFGKTYEFPTPRQTQIRNKRFAAKFDNNFIMVSNNLPYIEVYSQDSLKQSVRCDYSDVYQVKKTICAIEDKLDNDDNSYRHLCEDICVTNKYLYLLLIDYTNNDFNVNQIIKFEIYPVIKPVSILRLPGKYFTTFSVSEEDGIVYAYHYTDNTLREYLMDK